MLNTKLKVNMEQEEPTTIETPFKIVMIGDLYVGKTSLLVRFADDDFSEDYASTIGVDFRYRTMQINQKIVKLQIWDTTGQEKYKAITDSYFKGAHGIIFVFDMTERDTFFNMHNTVEEITEKVPLNVKFIAIGNKCDASEQIRVTERDIIKFQKKYQIRVFCTSARDSTNVSEAFIHLTKDMVQVVEDFKERTSKDAMIFSSDPSKAQRPGNSFHLKRPRNYASPQVNEYDDFDNNP